MSVILQRNTFEGVASQELADQITSKKKCLLKLPTYYQTPQIYYPKKLHIEQTSSEITAAYKATLVAGKSLLDLGGGLGVDSYYFAKKITSVFHCEINKELSQIAAHNFAVLGTKNITVHAIDGIEFLRQSPEGYDWVFVDPSRRDDQKKRVYALADCQPNVPENLDKIFQKTDYILLKTSPFWIFSRELKNSSL